MPVRHGRQTPREERLQIPNRRIVATMPSRGRGVSELENFAKLASDRGSVSRGLLPALEEFLHWNGCSSDRVGDPVAIHGRGRSDIPMPKHVRHLLEGYAGIGENRGCRVAELVGVPVPESSALCDSRNRPSEIAGIGRRSQLCGKHEIVIGPERARGQALSRPASPVSAECNDD
jgi:hypothetical protein